MDDEEVVGNTDDLFRQMEEDDLADKVALQVSARPIEYAKSRGMRPQRVYAAVKLFINSSGEKGLSPHLCECGKMVVNIKEADAFFMAKDKASNPQRAKAADEPD